MHRGESNRSPFITMGIAISDVPAKLLLSVKFLSRFCNENDGRILKQILERPCYHSLVTLMFVDGISKLI